MKIINFNFKSYIENKNNVHHCICYNLKSEYADLKQIFYRLVIRGNGYKWDSGKIYSSNTQNITCKNLKVKGFSEYEYSLFVETNQGSEKIEGKIETGILNYKNNGSWIFSNLKNKIETFEKTFTLQNYQNACARIAVCTTGSYNLYINDEKINSGISLSYGFFSEEIYMQEYIFNNFKKVNKIKITVNPKIVDSPGILLQIRIKDGKNKIIYLLSNDSWKGASFLDSDLINREVVLFNENSLLEKEDVKPKIIEYNNELIYDFQKIIFGKIIYDKKYTNKTILFSNDVNFANYYIVDKVNNLALYEFRYVKVIGEQTASLNDISGKVYSYLNYNKCIMKSNDTRIEKMIDHFYNEYQNNFSKDIYFQNTNNIEDYIVINNHLLLKTEKADYTLSYYCKHHISFETINYYYSIYNYRKSTLILKNIKIYFEEIFNNHKPSLSNINGEVFYKYITFLKKYIYVINNSNNKRIINKCKSLIKTYKKILKDKFFTINSYYFKDLDFIYAYILNDDINSLLLNDILSTIVQKYQNIEKCNEELFSKIIALLIRNNRIDLSFEYIHKRYGDDNCLKPFLFVELLNTFFGISLKLLNNETSLMIDIIDNNLKYISCNFTLGNEIIEYDCDEKYNINIILPSCYRAVIKLPYGKIKYIG